MADMPIDKVAFDTAFDFIMKFEGGYVNDKDDPGGATKYGISLVFLRGVRGYATADSRTILKLTRDDAKKIYKEHFWTPNRLGEIPSDLAIPVMDTAVNMGYRFAIKNLQRSLNKSGLVSEKLSVDGACGNKTVAAANNANVVKNIELVRAYYMMNRVIRYIAICERNPKMRKFFFGWLRRVGGLWVTK